MSSANIDGGMAAILGLSSTDVENICNEIDGTVEAVNYNEPKQTVIAGEKEVIEKLLTNPKVPNDVKSTNWAYYNIVSATNTFSFGKMTPLENKKEGKR